ncbi:MAG: DNA helicase UvrD [Nevskiaceae bacterium]|nr:MAG: DNA helicase UvrD [Nevskiaceae bacterium]
MCGRASRNCSRPCVPARRCPRRATTPRAAAATTPASAGRGAGVNEALNPARSVSVSASAGSGKTWLLTARIVRLLLDGHAPDGILALTFTRKAAAEMRQRVEARLRQLAFADDAALDALLAELGVSSDEAVRQRARRLYEQTLFHPWPLRATTLHAFCQDLIARFPLETGVAPGFEVGDSDDALIDAAWAGLQRQLLAEPHGAAAAALEVLAAEGLRESRLREIVVQFLARRADWLSYTEDQDDPLGYAIATLRDQLALGDGDPLDLLRTPALTETLTRFAALFAKAGKVGRINAASLQPALAAGGEAQFRDLCAQLLTQKNEPRAFKPSAEVRKRLGADTDALVQDFQTLADTLLRIAEQRARHATLRRTQAALALGAAALAALQRECRARNRYGFTDLEWLAYRLLHHAEAGAWVQFKLDQRIDHLLLDEFQDTSPTQWRLLLPLLEEMAAGDAGRARSLFIVGDPKQSIYGFRRANPELLPQAARWMDAHLAAHAATLSLSRRSAPAVIDFVNALFAPGLIADFPPHDTDRRDWGLVELAPLIEPDADAADEAPAFRDPLRQPRPDPENTRALREGRLIAQRIRALVDARWQVARKHGSGPLGYGDVLILTRRRTHLHALERALTEAGVPYTGAARGTLLETAEARDLAALLRFLLSPGRDLELAQVLRSPIVGAGDEELVRLATLARERNVSWFAALRAAPATAALTRAQRLLDAWRPLARTLPVHDLLDRICAEGNLAARYESALPPAQAARVRGNLNAFIQLALEADSGRYPSLSRFLDELARRSRGQDAPDETPPEAAHDQVRILTVHGAKGLEAPAVFLAQTGSQQRVHGAGWLVEWPSDAARPTHFLLGASRDQRDALTQSLIDQRTRREDVEEMNLLYVAVTRARQLLHLSGFASKKPGGGPTWHALATRAFDDLRVSAGDDGVRRFARGVPAVAAAAPAPTAPAPVDPRLRRPLQPITPTAPARPSAAEPEHDRAAIRHGVAVHWLLQQLARGRSDGLRGPLEATLGATLRDAEFNAWLAEARGVIEAPALRAYFDPARIRRAWDEVPISDGAINGVIDRLVDDGDTLWVLDYKTARDSDVAALRQRYRPQLDSYRAAVARLWPGRVVRAGLVLTQPPRWLDIG